MRKVGASEAKNKLAELLDAVGRGEEVMITRRGKPVAKLVRPGAATDRGAAVAAARRVMALREGVTLGGGVRLKDLIDNGRR
jgi:antitoxin (DNA-binding transcriptional repressor) of toxin-antitoxin stability system